MNIKNNSRYKASSEKIETAFLALCLNNPYDDISVSQICKQAKIDRSTFYAHYNDVSDLTAKIEAKFSHSMLNIFSFNGQPVHDSLIQMFTHIKENKYFYKAFLNLPYHNVADDGTRSDVLLNMDARKHHSFKNETELLYRSSFFGADVKEICRIWLDRDCKETPKEMADIILKEYTDRK